MKFKNPNTSKSLTCVAELDNTYKEVYQGFKLKDSTFNITIIIIYSKTLRSSVKMSTRVNTVDLEFNILARTFAQRISTDILDLILPEELKKSDGNLNNIRMERKILLVPVEFTLFPYWLQNFNMFQKFLERKSRNEIIISNLHLNIYWVCFTTTAVNVKSSTGKKIT